MFAHTWKPAGEIARSRRNRQRRFHPGAAARSSSPQARGGFMAISAGLALLSAALVLSCTLPSPGWAQDPAGTTFTSAGPPPSGSR